MENQKLDEVWFVVSPHSPFKKKASLAPDYDRLHLVNLAIENNPRLRSSNIEFALPKPSYTSDTLIFLREKFPTHNFSLIMGSDNIKSFHKWKNAEFLAKEYPIIVYQRPETEVVPTELEHTNLNINKGPLLNISASFLRGEIKAGRSIRYMVPEPVYKYLLDSTLYK